MIPLLVIVGSHLLGQLNIKLLEIKLNREQTKQLKIQQKTELDNLIVKKKKKLENLKNKKIELENLKIAKQQLITSAENLKLKAKERGNLALVEECEKKIAAAKQDIATYDTQISTTSALINSTEKEISLLNEKRNEQQLQSTGLLSGIANIFSTILSIGVGLITTIGTILTLTKYLNKEKLKSVGITLKEAAATKIAAAAEKIKAAFSMAGSAGKIPWVGWAIGAAILATMIGLAIAGAAGAFKSQEDRTDESIAKTREELNQLQADLYNLNSAKENVAKLGDEFETLSNKIVKTSEDLQRMEEIAQQINDTAGRTIVDTTESADEQLKQIRAYNLQQEAQVAIKTEEINETLGQGLIDAMAANAVGGRQAMRDAYDKYFETLKTDASFVNSLRTVGMSNLSGMEDASATTRDAILDMLVSNVDSQQYFSDKGLDTQAFEQYVTNALNTSEFQGGYTALVAQLDAVAEDGSMTAYADMLDRLGTSTNESFNNLIDSLKKSNPMFAAVADMGTEVARKFDKIGFSSDELNVMWDKLKKSSAASGKEVGKTFADMAAKIEQIGDVDKDGTISDLEARQAMYKQLVAEQLNAAQTAKAIVDGTDQASYAAGEYKKKLDQLTTKQDQIINKQKEIDKENDKSNPDEDKIEKLEAEMDSLTNEAAGLEGEINAVKDAAADCYVNIEELSTILGIVSAKEITEEFTKLASAMERVAKIGDIASMSLEEQMNLLADYPELLKAMERGYLTASETAQLYGDTIAQAQDDIAANKSNYKLKYGEESGLKLNTSEMTGFKQLFEDTDEGRQQREQFKAMGSLSVDDAWVKTMWGYDIADDQLTEEQKAIRDKFTSISDFITYLGNVRADVLEMSNMDFIQGQLSDGNYSVVMSEEQKEMWVAATEYAQQHRNALEGLNEEIEYLEVGSDEYIDTLRERNNLITTTLKDGSERLVKIKEETDDILRVKPEDENYGWLLQYTGENDDSLSEFVKFENGVAQINYEMLNSLNLTEEQRNAMLAYISTSISSLNELAEEEKDINDQRREDAETLAQSMIDSEAKILEAQIESLEKRKEAYEEYFDKIDALGEEEERTATMNDIAKQLSALAGGSDAASNSLRKDLMSQMDDLRKEEEEARKEAAREALIESIDDQIETTNEKLDTLNDSLNKVIQAILATSVDGVKVVTDGNGRVQLTLDGKVWKPYATGGLVDYTGPAMVHGSPESPEAFLSAQDTKNMQMLFAALDAALTKSTTINASGEVSNVNSVVVENINISTNELNNNQDFRSAGQIFAEEFGKAIKQRGLNVNVRK